MSAKRACLTNGPHHAPPPEKKKKKHQKKKKSGGGDIDPSVELTGEEECDIDKLRNFFEVPKRKFAKKKRAKEMEGNFDQWLLRTYGLVKEDWGGDGECAFRAVAGEFLLCIILAWVNIAPQGLCMALFLSLRLLALKKTPTGTWYVPLLHADARVQLHPERESKGHA